MNCGDLRRTATDHPRMRGEDPRLAAVALIFFGSPPHARGRLGFHCTQTISSGITPACAGKTKNLPTPGGLLSDHPRMRGEDCCSQSNCPPAPGSPPHARGRRTFNVAAAWSGSDHPRMRGEDGPRGYDQSKAPGSPPHARGRPMCCGPGADVFGITPACAGKTWRRSWGSPAGRDHPRMRGEDFFTS